MKQTKRILAASCAAFLLWLTAFAAASPDIPNKPPAMLEKAATHVVVGEVVRIYEAKEKEAKWEYTRYLAELKIEKLEKGEGASPGELIYVRWFTRRYRKGMPPPSSNGHRGWKLAKGERVRVYLARNAHDGFTPDNTDGGYNVLVPNGLEQLAAKGK